MKITKLLSLLFLSLVFLSNGCNEDENLEVEEGCDAPRCYVTKSTATNDGIPDGIEVIWQYKTLNGKKIIDKLIYPHDEAYSEIVYDNNNRFIGIKFYDNTLVQESTITYNNNGKPSTILTLYSNTTPREVKVVFEYDSENRLKSRKSYYNDIYRGKHVIQEYNASNQPTLSLLYDPNDELLETKKYIYDCNTASTKYVSNNILELIKIENIGSMFLECDSDCRLSRVLHTYAEDGSTGETVIEYDERGLTKGEYFTSSGNKPPSKVEFEYQCD